MAERNQNDTVTLRELLEVKAALQKLELLVIERFAAAKQALELQAKEYDRRLDHLNGEQGRMAVDRERFLPRESFEIFKNELDKRREIERKELDLRTTHMDKFMAASSGRDAGIGISWGVIVALIATIGAAVGVLVVVAK